MIQNMLRLDQDKTEFFLIANRNGSAALSDISLKFGELSIQRSTSISASPLMILSLCIPKSPLFVNLFIFTYVTFGVGYTSLYHLSGMPPHR